MVVAGAYGSLHVQLTATANLGKVPPTMGLTARGYSHAGRFLTVARQCKPLLTARTRWPDTYVCAYWPLVPSLTASLTLSRWRSWRRLC